MDIIGSIEEGAVDAVVPGGGVLVTVWKFVKPALPWLALLAGLAAFLWAVERHGEAKQRASDAKVIAGLRTDLAVANASTQSLIDEWDNVVDPAIIDWQKRETAKMADAHKATVAAQERFKPTSALIARLGVPARPAASCGAVRPVSNEEDAAWSALAK